MIACIIVNHLNPSFFVKKKTSNASKIVMMCIWLLFTLLIQQKELLGEIHWHVNQKPPLVDALEVQETLSYLETCGLLFEQWLLSHARIRNLDSEIIKNITKGYDYFSGWLTSILNEGNILLPIIL